MAQHRRANFSGQDSAVHLHLKEKDPFFEDNVFAEKTDGLKEELKNQKGTHLQCSTESPPPPDSLTTIRNWVHLAQENHMWRPVKSTT